MPVDLKVPIKISDELSEDIIDSTGLLDLASGEIYRIEYEDYDLEGSSRVAELAGLRLIDKRGVIYDLFGDCWRLAHDTDVNYMLTAKRPEAS